MSKITPGPWTVDVSYRGKDRQRSDYVIRGKGDNLPDGGRIALVGDGRHVLDPKPNPVVEANVLAISKVPELLDLATLVCLEVECYCDSMFVGRGACAHCAADAILKEVRQ